MFDNFKKRMEDSKLQEQQLTMFSEMASGDDTDTFMDNILGDHPLSSKEEQECSKILDKIPESDMDKGDITKDEMKEAEKIVYEPSIEELASDM